MFGMDNEYGRLTILSEYTLDGRRYCRCECKCGKECNIRKDSILTGRTQSCGCLLSESATIRATKHGMSYSTELKVYRGMITRCYYRSHGSFHRYGGRGIKVCERWQGEGGFENFVKDLGLRPSSDYTLERKDNDGDYTPENCIWGTKEEQYSNKSTNRLLTFQGKTQTIAKWCRETGISRGSLIGRLDQLGWSVEEALSTPTKKYIR